MVEKKKEWRERVVQGSSSKDKQGGLKRSILGKGKELGGRKKVSSRFR